MRISEAQYQRQTEWNKANLSRFAVIYPNDFAAEVREAVKASGKSINAYIREAIEEKMMKDETRDQTRIKERV